MGQKARAESWLGWGAGTRLSIPCASVPHHCAVKEPLHGCVLLGPCSCGLWSLAVPFPQVLGCGTPAVTLPNLHPGPASEGSNKSHSWVLY